MAGAVQRAKAGTQVFVALAVRRPQVMAACQKQCFDYKRSAAMNLRPLSWQ